MAEKKMTEAEAKKVAEEARKKHEATIAQLRLDQLEYELASAELNRAKDRFYRADMARNKSQNECINADDDAKRAFIQLGKIQVELRGAV